MKLINFQHHTLSKSGMLPLIVNTIDAPLANPGCLNIPGFKGPSAARAGVVPEVGFSFETVQLLHLARDRD